MCDFVIDKTSLQGSSWEDIVDKYGQNQSFESDDEEDPNRNFIPLDELPESVSTTNKKVKKSSESIFNLENSYLITNYTKEGKDKNDKNEFKKFLEKSSISEKLLTVPVRKSKNALKKERKAEREKTKGKDWFNLPAPELTDEIKNDLEILKMRSVLDSKHMYKKNNIPVTLKYFQIGKVVEGPADFYSGRIPKSQRKKTLVDELLADSNFRAYQKKKYKEIVDDNRRKKRKASQMKPPKNKKSKNEWLSWD